MVETLPSASFPVNQITLRGYQSSAVEKTLAEFRNFRKLLIVLPTGAGKTIVFAALIALIVRKYRVLILCHREELIQQAAAKVAMVTGIQPQIEKAESTASLDALIVVASVQSMRRRLGRYASNHFGLVICDEAHHALSGEWQAVLKHFDSYARVLGVTATPHRGDRRNMGEYFEHIAYEVPLFDLINQGFLSRIMIESIPLGADLTPVSRSTGDFNGEQVDQALAPVLGKAAAAVAERCNGRKVLVFLPLIKTSLEFKERLLACGLRAEHVDGTSENRREILDSFERGDVQVLCNSSLLTEGYDCPSVSCVVILRPTRSRALYAQMIGRGTRVHPGKENLLLLDFIYQYERHDLVKPAHLVAKSDEEAEEISKKSEQSQLAMDLEKVARDVAAAREEALRQQIAKNARREAKVFDAMEFFLAINKPELAEWEPEMPWHSMPITEPQRTRLERSGIDISSVKGRGHASAILDQLINRSALGLATPKQVRTLRKLGHKSPETATFTQALTFINVRFGHNKPSRKSSSN